MLQFTLYAYYLDTISPQLVCISSIKYEEKPVWTGFLDVKTKILDLGDRFKSGHNDRVV